MKQSYTEVLQTDSFLFSKFYRYIIWIRYHYKKSNFQTHKLMQIKIMYIVRYIRKNLNQKNYLLKHQKLTKLNNIRFSNFTEKNSQGI